MKILNNNSRLPLVKKLINNRIANSFMELLYLMILKEEYKILCTSVFLYSM